MNKNIKKVLVRVEYHGQIWYEYISVEQCHGFKSFEGSSPRKDRGYHHQIDEQNPPKEHRV